MLVIERHQGKSIFLVTDDGKLIKITVCRIRGNKIRLGIEAPRPGVEIWREEIFPGLDKIAIDKPK